MNPKSEEHVVIVDPNGVYVAHLADHYTGAGLVVHASTSKSNAQVDVWGLAQRSILPHVVVANWYSEIGPQKKFYEGIRREVDYTMLSLFKNIQMMNQKMSHEPILMVCYTDNPEECLSELKYEQLDDVVHVIRHDGRNVAELIDKLDEIEQAAETSHSFDEVAALCSVADDNADSTCYINLSDYTPSTRRLTR